MGQSFFKRSAVYALLGTALMPLVAFQPFLYPYIFTKTIFFRLLVEVAAALFLVGAWIVPSKWRISFSKSEFQNLVKNPFVLAVFAFLISAAISTTFAVNPFRAFWGEIERGDGFFSILHYVAFFLLALAVFQEKEWKLFFRISVIVASITMFYAWLQYAGIEAFPFALHPAPRPGSFLGNPALFGTYLLFVAGISPILFFLEKGSRAWRYVSFGTGCFAFITMFVINVAGTLVGLVAGILFLLLFFMFSGRSNGKIVFSGKEISARAVSAVFLCAMLLFGGIFWGTRNASLWRSIPGFGRVSLLFTDDSSVKTRLLALGSSWEAFREKPFFGWGIENYNVGYNAHYNPEYAAYEEAWFDRAHNKLAEVAVMQGIVGLLSYLSIFIAFFYLLFRRNGLGTHHQIFPKIKPFLAALMVAYIAQNLFLFDSPVSLLMLFSVSGFLLWNIGERKEGRDPESPQKKRNPTSVSFAIAGIVVLAYACYWGLILPASQAAAYTNALREKVGEKILAAAPRFLEPYTYLQSDLRPIFVQTLTEAGLLRNRDFSALTDKGIRALEELAEEEKNYEPRNFILLGETYNEKGKDNPEFFITAEAYLRRALLLSPKRQDAYYPLAFALAGQERFDEAIKIARDAVALNPNAAKARYFLGIELAIAGKRYWDEAESELARAQEIGFIALVPSDLENITVIYKEMLYAYITNKDAERVIRIAGRLKNTRPEFAKDIDIIAAFAKEGDWKALFGLLDSSLQ